MPDQLEVLTDGTVIRLYTSTRFPKGKTTALQEHFAFSEAERRIGEHQGKWHVSVWDSNRTSPEQAQRFMQTPAEREAFTLKTTDISGLSLSSNPGHRLNVLRDPVPGDAGDGHCGINGLHVPTSGERRAWRTLLAEKAVWLRTVARVDASLPAAPPSSTPSE
jgi:hypothetical protein